MDYKYYTVSKEEKLSSIAAKLDSTPQEIKAHNPELRTFSGLLGGEFVSVGQRVKIPIPKQIKSEISVEENYINNLEFEQKARYRCEQFNITRIEEEVISYSKQKKEYFVEFNFSLHLAQIKLLDHYYEFNPPGLS